MVVFIVEPAGLYHNPPFGSVHWGRSEARQLATHPILAYNTARIHPAGCDGTKPL